jgi:predicted Zn-dependent peptidase
MAACAQRSTTVALASGRLRTQDVAQAQAHVAGCEECRGIVSEVASAPTVRVDGAPEATMTSPNRSSQPAIVDHVSRVWIGRYKVIKKLGAGGMGAVFEAEDPELDRKVAIKLLHGTSDTASARLVREAKALAKLRHPNVVTIYEVGRDSGDAFVAMELVAGTTLREWLHGEHSFAARLDAMIQAGQGLAAAHAEGLIHRDFKPENAMVGADGRVQVLDFGLAKSATTPSMDPEEPAPRPSQEAVDFITRTGTLLGTPAYMAPEQFAAADTDARTDQFAYCVALFEVLHGFRPFAGHSHAMLCEAVSTGRIVEGRPLSPQVPPHVQAAILRGLSVKPADRFPDMKALLAALQMRRGSKQRWVIAIVATAAVAAGGAAWTISRRSAASTAPVASANDALFAASGVPAPQPTPVFGDPFKVTVHRLSNGLSVWISPNRKSPRIDARLVLRAGSRDAKGIGGLAHMVEHMTFKGTSRVGTVDFTAESTHLAKLRTLYAQLAKATTEPEKTKLFGEIDAETVAASRYSNPGELLEAASALGVRGYSATTDYDATVFRADIPSNKFTLWAKLEGERLSDPVFRAFHLEAGVVFDEIHQKRSAGPMYVLHDALIGATFAGHPYELSPGGSFADIIAEPFTAAEEFHRTWYAPNNAALLLAGDIDPEQAIPVLERELGRWKPHPFPRREPHPIAPLAGEVERTVKGMEVGFAIIGWPTVPQGHADEDALYVLSALVDHLGQPQAGSTRVQSYPIPMIEAGLFVATAAPSGEQSQAAANARLDDLVRTIQAGQFSDETLASVLLNKTLELDRAHDNNDVRIQRMASAYLSGRGWTYAVARKARINALTKADIVRVAKQYLTNRRVVVTAEVGTYEMPAVKLSKITPLESAAKAKTSPFIASLLAEETVEIPPRFVAEGRDYAIGDTPAGPLITVANPDDTQYVLRMRWDIGARQLPLVCAALHVLDHAGTGEGDVAARRARWFARAQTAQIACYGQGVEVEVTGVDGTFDEDWPDVERWLTGTGITDAVWKSAIDEFLLSRTWGRSGDGLVSALDLFTAFEAKSPWIVGADTTTIKRATAADARASLQSLLAVRRTLAYFGPRAADAIHIPATVNVTRDPPAHEPERLLPISGTRIFTLDTGANRSVNATIRIPLGTLDHAQLAIPHVFANYLSDGGNGVLWNAFRNLRGISYSGGSARIQEGYRPGDETSLVIRFATTAEQLAPALELALSLVRSPEIDREQVKAAQQRTEEAFRANWIPPRELPVTVADWRARGLEADPRSVMFEATRRITDRDLVKLATQVAAARTFISITGDVSKIDAARVQALGKVQAVKPTSLFTP